MRASQKKIHYHKNSIMVWAGLLKLYIYGYFLKV